MITTKGNIELLQGDCLELMKQIQDKSIDLILCDLPYGTTACSWDEIIPFDKLWKQYNRIVKDNGIIVLNASQPFTSKLVMSNIALFKHHWVWDKKRGVGHLLAKKRPMMCTEDIIVFFKDLNERKSQVTSFVALRKYFEAVLLQVNVSKKEILNNVGQRADHCFRYKSTQWDIPTEDTYKELIRIYNIDKFLFFRSYNSLLKEYRVEESKFKDVIYNPQMRKREVPRLSKVKATDNTCYGNYKSFKGEVLNEKYPINLIEFSKSNHKDMLLHPTQKPLALTEYLVKTYSNENDLVLDNCMGSGSTGVACKNLNRKFIGIELDKKYFEIAKKRIDEVGKQSKLCEEILSNKGGYEV